MSASPSASKDRAALACRRGRLRRAIAALHLWIALALGVYIVVLSISGSAIVFRRELNVWLVPREVPSIAGTKLTGDDLRDAVEAAYPSHAVQSVRERDDPARPVLVTLERGGATVERLFDPYRGADLGSSYPATLRAVEWLVDLHDSLLSGYSGRRVNGVGGGLMVLLIVSGAIIWWPGRRRWRQRLVLGRPALSRRFASQLHNVVGVTSLTLLLVWALTAVYFAFPDPFERAIDFFDDDLSDAQRPGEALLLTLIKLHFGRFGGLSIRFLWVVLGLLPALLFITGFAMWWTSVVRRRRVADRSSPLAAPMLADAERSA